MAEQDKAAIIEVMNLYAFALDAHEWDLFDGIFTEDVVMDMGLIGVTWTGRTEFKQGLQNSCAALDAHQHLMTGHLVHVDGDTARAFCYGNWTLVREAAEGGRTWLGMGWYNDELVRVDGGWKFSRRVCRLISWTGNLRVIDPSGKLDLDANSIALFKSHEGRDLGFVKTLKDH